MISMDEYGALVEELRDDPTFVDALVRLRGGLYHALAATHPNDRKKHYAILAQLLREVYQRLEAQR